MSKKTVYPVNGDKLRLCLAKKGLKISVASAQMGFNANFLNDCARRGVISAVGKVSLESLFGIRYEDYKAEEPKMETEQEPEIPEEPRKMELAVPQEFWISLYNHIYRAVYEAVKKAWTE